MVGQQIPAPPVVLEEPLAEVLEMVVLLAVMVELVAHHQVQEVVEELADTLELVVMVVMVMPLLPPEEMVPGVLEEVVLVATVEEMVEMAAAQVFLVKVQVEMVALLSRVAIQIMGVVEVVLPQVNDLGVVVPVVFSMMMDNLENVALSELFGVREDNSRIQELEMMALQHRHKWFWHRPHRIS